MLHYDWTKNGEQVKLTVEISWVTLTVFYSDGTRYNGMVSNATTSCSSCRWVQTYITSGEAQARTDWNAQGGLKPRPLIAGDPLHPERLWDAPGANSVYGRTFKHFVSTIGIVRDNTFYYLGSITWGYDVDRRGRTQVFRPRISTPSEQAGSLRTLRSDPNTELQFRPFR